MTDLDRAIAAAREALADYNASKTRLDLAGVSVRLRDLLAALDAARGEAVAYAPKGDAMFEPAWAVTNPILYSTDADDRVPLYAAPPAAMAVPVDPLSQEALLRRIAELQAQQPAALAVPANATPMRQPRAELARLVESINAAVYANGNGLSVTEAIGALELAKLELFKEQEQ